MNVQADRLVDVTDSLEISDSSLALPVTIISKIRFAAKRIDSECPLLFPGTLLIRDT